MIKRLTLLIFIIGMLVAVTGCWPGFVNASLTADPQSGIPTIFAGGMEVTFTTNGTFDSIDYGDDETGTNPVHLYKKVGIYRVKALVLINGDLRSATTTITVKNDHPQVYPPFFAGSYPQIGGRSILDGRKQQHGCTGGGNSSDYPWQIDEGGNQYPPFPGTALNYGAWPRYGEVFTYDWKITIKYLDGRSDHVVYANGSKEYPLSLIGWHVGEDIQIYPDLLPVPTIDGVWIPPTLSPLSVCVEDEDTSCALEKDPWEGWPENVTGVSVVARVVVEMTVTNQLGCYTATSNTLDVYTGGGCSKPALESI